VLAGITQEPITPSLQGDILPPIFAIGLFLLFCVAYALISLYHHKSVTIVLTGSVLAVAAAFLAQLLGVPQFSLYIVHALIRMMGLDLNENIILTCCIRSECRRIVIGFIISYKKEKNIK